MSDVKKVLVIGSGPIIIGQAAEFDYSGTQACRALREESGKLLDPEMAKCWISNTRASISV